MQGLGLRLNPRLNPKPSAADHSAPALLYPQSCSTLRPLPQPPEPGHSRARRLGCTAAPQACPVKARVLAQGRNSCRLPLSLPPDPVNELTDPGTQFSNWNPHVMSTTVWAYESFVQVGCMLQTAYPVCCACPTPFWPALDPPRPCVGQEHSHQAWWWRPCCTVCPVGCCPLLVQA